MSLSLPTLIANLTSSLKSSIAVVPQSKDASSPENGISLLDIKNECFLAYLQNLIFLIILKIRHTKCEIALEKPDQLGTQQLDGLEDNVIRKLVEIRHYAEKGILPLESRMKYQLDKVLRAASNASTETRNDITRADQTKATNSNDGDGASEDGELDGDELKSTNSRTFSPQIDELSYRPNPSALIRLSSAATLVQGSKQNADQAPGIYRPPKVTPTAYPSTASLDREKRNNRKMRSTVMDEFVTNELSVAPAPLPSIGSAIDASGRRTKSSAEKVAEAERAAYEEENFIRLPPESKKRRAQLAKSRPRENGYGGEEWRLLGNDADRIQKVTRDRDRNNILERSRKRPKISTGQASGNIGDEFARRKRAVTKSLKRKGKR